jgi:uncharacterized repeat protein (TIGR01451 family)/LPXTG-motif cell wall-anchored protein
MFKYLFLSLLSLFLFVGSVSADTQVSCESGYGTTCRTGELELEKKVKNPQTGELVGSLNANGANFLAGQEVFFRIEVKNGGDDNLSNVAVVDKLPDYVDFIAGPGEYSKDSRKVTWTISELKAGETKMFDLKVKVSKDLPDMGISCLTNWAEARKDSLLAQDTAVFCIQTKVLGTVTELPKTGASNNQKVLISSMLMLGTSVLLLKKFNLV